MQQFQTLKRLLFFYTLSLLIMLMLYYSSLFSELQNQSERHSVQVFEWLQHEMIEHSVAANHDIETILQQPFFEGFSYQIILMLPSGQTYVHVKTRKGENPFTTITFPELADEDRAGSYQLNTRNLSGVIQLDSGYQLYVVLRHQPIDINWLSYYYWLPLMAAIGLFMMALFYVLKRRVHWEKLLFYTENLITTAQESYTPPPFVTKDATLEFLRLGHALSRVNFKLHSNHRRIKTLSHRLERLVDQAPLPMLMLMREGEISFFNQRFEQIFATVFTRNVSYNLTDFVTGSDKATQQLLQKLSAQRVTRTLLVTGLENKQTYQLHITPWFGEHGQVHGFTVLLNSVEKFIQQTEELQRQNHQLQLQIKEFHKLRSIIGHELRTPLNAIIGSLDLIESPQLTAEQQETLATLNQSTQSMLTMLNDMLDMAKIEAGKAQIVNESTDLYKIGQHVSDLMVGSARRQNIELHYLFMPDCPRHIHTDASRVQQILLNLVDNAIKFTQSGYVALVIDAVSTPQAFPNKKGVKQLDYDRQTIAPTAHEPEEATPHHWIRFQVIDTGIGITHKEQQQLFSYFNQANAQISQNFGGTGLGLAISNSFAHLLDGCIKLDSDGISGSTFTLYLPCRAPTYLSVYHARRHTKNIHLIACINLPIYTTYLRTLCQRLAISADIYHADTLPSAAQIQTAIEALPSHCMPILLLDYEYYADNLEAQQDFETLLSLDNVPKILLSMKPERSITASLFDRIDGFLNKPIDTTLLISELIRLTKGFVTGAPVDLKPLPSAAPKLMSHTDRHTTEAQNREDKVTDIKTIPINDADKDNRFEDNALSMDKKPNHQSLASSLILIVEDNLTNQKITGKLLSKLGFESIVANDGAQALQVLAERRADIALILMDCRMPVMDGLEATRAIRAQGDNIAIIALTANNTDEDQLACQEAGMDAFLGKPVKKDKLQALLTQFLS